MERKDFAPEAWEFLLEVAPKVIWWKTAGESLQFPRQVIAGVMDLGTFEETRKLQSLVSKSLLQEVLSHAEPGQFCPRSWTYWHLCLNGLVDSQVPAEPVRGYP